MMNKHLARALLAAMMWTLIFALAIIGGECIAQAALIAAGVMASTAALFTFVAVAVYLADRAGL